MFDTCADHVLQRRAARGAAPAAWIVTPKFSDPDQRPLVVAHGITRQPEAIARRLAQRAAGLGRVLIAPDFDAVRFPRYQRAVSGRRADVALRALLDALAVEGLMPPGPIDLAGYSGGAQFAHRFAWLHPAQTARLTVAAAGWWTFPDAAPFPYGCGPSLEGPPHVGRCLAAGLPAFLDRDIVVAVGARDDAPDAATRRGPELDAQQGTDRLARARRWVAAMAEAAEALGAPRRPRLVVLPGCGHDVFDCLDAGLDKLILPAPSAHR